MILKFLLYDFNKSPFVLTFTIIAILTVHNSLKTVKYGQNDHKNIRLMDKNYCTNKKMIIRTGLNVKIELYLNGKYVILKGMNTQLHIINTGTVHYTVR